MAYITLRDVQLAFGGPALLDGANFSLERGERVCLIGRNGEGKSTLLKLIEGSLLPDSGEVSLQKWHHHFDVGARRADGLGQSGGYRGRRRR